MPTSIPYQIQSCPATIIIMIIIETIINPANTASIRLHTHTASDSKVITTLKSHLISFVNMSWSLIMWSKKFFNSINKVLSTQTDVSPLYRFYWIDLIMFPGGSGGQRVDSLNIVHIFGDVFCIWLQGYKSKRDGIAGSIPILGGLCYHYERDRGMMENFSPPRAFQWCGGDRGELYEF